MHREAFRNVFYPKCRPAHTLLTTAELSSKLSKLLFLRSFTPALVVLLFFFFSCCFRNLPKSLQLVLLASECQSPQSLRTIVFTSLDYLCSARSPRASRYVS